MSVCLLTYKQSKWLIFGQHLFKIIYVYGENCWVLSYQQFGLNFLLDVSVENITDELTSQNVGGIGAVV